MILPDISTAEGRKGWALISLVGGAMVFTVFAAAGVYLVRHSPGMSFWLALAAHGQVLIVLSVIGALLVRGRMVKVSREGVEITDGKGEGQ